MDNNKQLSSNNSATNLKQIISTSVATEAIEWMFELQSEDSSAETYQNLMLWRKQSAEHEQAWQRIEILNKKLKSVSSPLAKAVTYSGLTEKDQLSRRDSFKALALFLVVGSSTLLIEKQIPWQSILADVHTKIGQRQRITLADGSVLDLNTDTAISIDFTQLERRVYLHKGEILVVTAKDKQAVPRPFIVETQQGELMPIGTKFSVYQRDEQCRLMVIEGAVQVHPRGELNLWEIIKAQQQVHFDQYGFYNIEAADENTMAWTSGMIIASGMRLADFLNELNLHRSGVLRCDPAVENIKLSGSYPLADTNLILTSLAQTLPIEISYMTNLWVTVKAKSS